MNVKYGERVDLVDINCTFPSFKARKRLEKCGKVLIKTARTHLLRTLLIYKRFSVRLAA
jgi:hypothetical protein